MLCNDILQGNKIRLRQLRIEDCNDVYVNWLNDKEVNQYLESKFTHWTLEKVIQFVESVLSSSNAYIFAIEYNGKHIGNIKIDKINQYHNSAEIGYIIGERCHWGKGIITEAIHLVCDYCFKQLALHRVEAGVYANAVGSWKALEKNGFVREGIYRKNVLFNGSYIDSYKYGLLRSDFCKTEEKIYES